MKSERIGKTSSFGSIMRKRLSDITNTHSQPKLGGLEQRHPQFSHSTEDLINQFVMEKSTLMKLIEEKNKIIELSGNELRNLRTSYQKLQLQNWNLAQSNSHILAELNLGREKLKALQHEVVCKEALLKAKNLELEGKADKECPNTGSLDGEKVAEECSQNANNDAKLCNLNRRGTARSRSMVPSTTHQQAAEKEKTESKRRCLRRQSARFKSSTANLFEIEDAKFPVTEMLDTRVRAACPIQSAGCSVEKEETHEPRTEAQTCHRASIGRPLRRAAEKVQSYKEAPLNTKMRRAQ